MQQRFGLIGYPLGHSFSRTYFNEKFEQECIDAHYDNFPIEDIALLYDIISSEPKLCGLNVTIPYKEVIIPYLDELQGAACEIGAVNVVKIERNRDSRLNLLGFNTDWEGFTSALMPLIEGENHYCALVLGTGGASKAVGYALNRLGLATTFVSRSPAGRKMVVGYEDLTPEMMTEHTIVVNTTPLGTYPDTDSAPDIPYDKLTPRHVCFDLVYNPYETRFMALSSERGAKVSNGLGMLHAQAEAAWRIWNSPD